MFYFKKFKNKYKSNLKFNKDTLGPCVNVYE